MAIGARFSLNKLCKEDPKIKKSLQAAEAAEGRSIRHGDVVVLKVEQDQEEYRGTCHYVAYGDPKDLALVKTGGEYGYTVPLEFWDLPGGRWGIYGYPLSEALVPDKAFLASAGEELKNFKGRLEVPQGFGMRPDYYDLDSDVRHPQILQIRREIAMVSAMNGSDAASAPASAGDQLSSSSRSSSIDDDDSSDEPTSVRVRRGKSNREDEKSAGKGKKPTVAKTSKATTKKKPPTKKASVKTTQTKTSSSKKVTKKVPAKKAPAKSSKKKVPLTKKKVVAKKPLAKKSTQKRTVPAAKPKPKKKPVTEKKKKKAPVAEKKKTAQKKTKKTNTKQSSSAKAPSSRKKNPPKVTAAKKAARKK